MDNLGKYNKPFYKVKQINNHKTYLHRLIAEAQPGEYVDHINGDIQDNRPENLRICTQAQNMANMKMHKDNKVGYKGVTYQRGKFITHVWSGIKQIYLGRYHTAEEAAFVYNQVAGQLFGEFARLNNLESTNG